MQVVGDVSAGFSHWRSLETSSCRGERYGFRHPLRRRPTLRNGSEASGRIWEEPKSDVGNTHANRP